MQPRLEGLAVFGLSRAIHSRVSGVSSVSGCRSLFRVLVLPGRNESSTVCDLL